MESPKLIPCPVCTGGPGVEGSCVVCGSSPCHICGNVDGLIDEAEFTQEQPVLAAVLQILETAKRPATPATSNALSEQLTRLSRLMERPDTKVPLETFALLDDAQRKIALVAFGSSIIISFMKAIARENPRRIILPGRPR